MALHAFTDADLFMSYLSRMHPSRFYGTNRLTKSIPGDGSISDDSASDSDDDNIPLSNLRLPNSRKQPIIIPESDLDTSDDENNIVNPKQMKKTKQKNIQKKN